MPEPTAGPPRLAWVRSGRTEVAVDVDRGTFAVVRDAASGVVHFDARPDPERLGRSFRVIAPTPSWRAHLAEPHLPGAPAPAVEEADGTLVIRWADLPGPDGPTGIEADLSVRAGDGDRVELSLTLVNHRDGDLTDVLFPWLGGWQPGGTSEDALVLGGVRRADPHAYPRERGITLGRWHQRDYWVYPRDVYCPWLDISREGGGVSLVSEQRSAEMLGMILENLAGYEPGLEQSVGFFHFARVRPGERWTSRPIAVAVHGGDWRVTADRYTAWVDGWFKPAPTPGWARDAIGVQNVLFTAQDGTRWHAFDEVPALARAGLAAGVPHLTVWHAYASGPDPGFFLVEGRFDAQDEAALRAGIRGARAAGAHVSVIHNYRIVAPASRFYREVAHREVALRYDGTPFVEEYQYSAWHPIFETQHTGPMLYTLDPRAPGFRERVLASVGRALNVEFDSFHIDQPHMHWPSYRTDVTPAAPDTVHTATVALLHDLRALIARRDPDGILVGEWGDVFGAEAVDLWFSWAEDVADLERAAYALPQTMWSVMVDADSSRASRAFGFGAQLFLCTRGLTGSLADVPAFAEHVRRLAALRTACRDRYARGRYRGTSGLSVSADGAATAGLVESRAGSCVVVASPGGPGTVRVELTGEQVAGPAGGAGPGTLFRLDGTREAVRRDRLEVELEPDEVAVWYPSGRRA